MTRILPLVTRLSLPLGGKRGVGLKRGMGNEEMGNGNEEMECGNRSKHHAMAPPSLRKALNFKRT